MSASTYAGGESRISSHELQVAMTFEEIAIALGYPPGERGRKAVFMTYKKALQKLRRRPHSVQKLRELVECRERGVY